MPTNFQKALREGKYNRVRVLCGFNQDEASRFVQEPTVEQYTSFVDHVFGDKAQEVKDRFPVNEDNVRERSQDLVRSCFCLSGLKMMADKMSHDGLGVYAYNFRFCPQVIANNPLGVTRVTETPFIFNQSPETIYNDPQAGQVSQDMHKYWVNFIKNGTPNLKGMPTWMRYTPDGQNFMTFEGTSSLQPVPNFDDINFIVERMKEL